VVFARALGAIFFVFVCRQTVDESSLCARLNRYLLLLLLRMYSHNNRKHMYASVDSHVMSRTVQRENLAE
jgi:hypothetical protein